MTNRTAEAALLGGSSFLGSFRRVAVLWLLLALGAPVAAQESGSTASAPEAIPLGQISTRAQELEAVVRAIDVEQTQPEEKQVDAELTALADRQTKAAEALENVLSRRYSPGELEGLVRTWRRLARDVAALEAREDERTHALEARASEKKLDEQLDRATALLDRVRAVRIALTPWLARVDAAKTTLAGSLLEQQDEPFWRSLPGPEVVRAAPEKFRTNVAEIFGELDHHIRQRAVGLVIQALIFLVLCWVFTRARISRAERHGEGVEPPFDALRHPWAAALLVAVVLAPLVEPIRIRGFQLIVLPLALAAWYRVVSGMMSPALRSPLLVLTGLGILTLFRIVVAELMLVERLVLFFELTAALAGIAWLRRPDRLQHVPWREASGPWLRAFGVWMQVAAPSLVIGLIALLLGYTVLADRISTIVIWGSVGGAAWVAMARIAEEITENYVLAGSLDRLRSIASNRTTFLRFFGRATRFVGVLLWTYTTLTVAGLWSPAREGLAALLAAPLGYGSFSISLGGVVAFGLTLWLSWLLARLVSFLLDHELFGRIRMPPGVPFALATFTRYTILVLGFVAAMGAVGFSIDRVTIMLSALGVGIGFGLQNVVNNFVSGAMLLFERPIRVGDQVQIQDLFGVITQIGPRASKMRTFDGSEVIVPNGDFISGRVVNWTLSDSRRRIILPVGVAYGTPPRQVIELLTNVAKAHPEVLAEPAPVVLFRSFGESSLDFEVRAFTEGNFIAVMSDLAVATSEALDEAGITIPFPQRDLHLRNPAELREALRGLGSEPPEG
jgi:small-conductance mechanosensitive channel